MHQAIRPMMFGFWLFVLIPAASAQFRETPPPPYPQAVARQQIRSMLEQVEPGNRQQTVAGLSRMLTWYRDLIDEELIAAWQRDGRSNLPELITSLADSRVASAVVEFSWRNRRQVVFNLSYAPMLENLMARYGASAKPVVDDLLERGGASPPVSALLQSEAEAVCRILLDMPDTGTWRKDALQILPRYRRTAENLLDEDLRGNDREKADRAQFWLADMHKMDTSRGGRVDTTAPTPPPISSGFQNDRSTPGPQRPTVRRSDSDPPASPDSIHSSPPVTAPSNGVYRAGGGVSEPSVLYKIDPEYSDVARRLRASGVVALSVVVGLDGAAKDIRLIKSLGYGLDEKAIEAVHKWLFVSGMKGGQPVPVRANIEVNFSIGTDTEWRSGPMAFSMAAGFIPPEVIYGDMPTPDREVSHESVVLRFTVTTGGVVKDIQMIHGNQSAADALSRSLAGWKFRPAVQANRAVEATGRVLFVKGDGDGTIVALPAPPPSANSAPSAPEPAPKKTEPMTEPATINSGTVVTGTLRRMAERDLVLQTASGKLLRFRLLPKTEFRSASGRPVRDSLVHAGDHISMEVNPDDVETAVAVIVIAPGSASERVAASAPVEELRVATPDSDDFGRESKIR